jgi:hypothetical protein
MRTQPRKRTRNDGTTTPRSLALRSEPQSAHRYFTDGSNLYRFAGWLTPSGSAELAALEDCRTLRILVVSAEYLTAARLRPVV